MHVEGNFAPVFKTIISKSKSMNTQKNEKEVMMEAELQIIKDMTELLKHNPEEHLRWNSTRQDLMEMIHIVYESETIKDEYNVPVPYKTLVSMYCIILGEKIPRNPHAYVLQSNSCQGVKKQKLLLRYRGIFIVDCSF